MLPLFITFNYFRCGDYYSASTRISSFTLQIFYTPSALQGVADYLMFFILMRIVLIFSISS